MCELQMTIYFKYTTTSLQLITRDCLNFEMGRMLARPFVYKCEIQDLYTGLMNRLFSGSVSQ